MLAVVTLVEIVALAIAVALADAEEVELDDVKLEVEFDVVELVPSAKASAGKSDTARILNIND
jgi:hypothetical protein